MSLTDPIANLLTALRNASLAGKPHVDVPASRIGLGVVECLKAEGFIGNCRFLKEGNPQGFLRVYLKYRQDRRPVLRHIRRVSKPGQRIYVGKNRVPKVFSGIGVSILTTPQGILSDTQARAKGVGGEVICHVW